MTVIVAIPHNGRVYMGADSRAVQGWSIIELAEPKLWKQGGMLFGFTGAIREQQILQFATPIPARSDDVDVLHWLGVRRVDRWISMSNWKSEALEAAGIQILQRVAILPELVPQHAQVEICAKRAAGYFG